MGVPLDIVDVLDVIRYQQTLRSQREAAIQKRWYKGLWKWFTCKKKEK
jgi:hypothetical protein